MLIILFLALGAEISVPSYVAYEGVDDAAVDPKLSSNNTAFVKFLGKVGSADACAAACGAWNNGSDVCESFTLYNSSAPVQLRGRCYGHVTVAWIPHPTNTALSGRMMIRPCVSALSCSLNGVCNVSGAGCICNIGWRGLKCGELNLREVNRSAVGFNDSNISSWGAAIVSAPSPSGSGGTQWHSFTCEWSQSCGVDQWFTNSQVSHAVSSSPAGPYKRTGLLFPPFSTNPTLSQTRGPNGELVMVMGMATANGSARVPSHECTGCEGGSSTNRSCRPSARPFSPT
jgi:hypothetical protein